MASTHLPQPDRPSDPAPVLPAPPEPALHCASEAGEAAPLLDLSRMEPPRRLAEARLEEVTIDGICGVY